MSGLIARCCRLVEILLDGGAPGTFARTNPIITQQGAAYAVYEYFCESCQKEFEKVLSFHEHDEAKVVCPNCATDKVHQVMTRFVAVTSKKS